MKKLLTILAATWLVVGTGCISLPPGYTKAEFDALPPEKRAELIENERAARQARWDQMKADQGKQRLAEEEAIQKLKANLSYGDVIIVEVERAAAESSGKLVSLKPVQVELVKGETVAIPFQTPKGFVTLTMTYSSEIGGLYLNEHESCLNVGPDRGDPAWVLGKRYQPKERFKGASYIKELTIFIRYKNLPR